MLFCLSVLSISQRYFHYLLFWAMFLPLDEKWSIDQLYKRKGVQKQSDDVENDYTTFVSLATIGLKAQIFWIYLDAGKNSSGLII